MRRRLILIDDINNNIWYFKNALILISSQRTNFQNSMLHLKLFLAHFPNCLEVSQSKCNCKARMKKPNATKLFYWLTNNNDNVLWLILTCTVSTLYSIFISCITHGAGQLPLLASCSSLGKPFAFKILSSLWLAKTISNLLGHTYLIW